MNFTGAFVLGFGAMMGIGAAIALFTLVFVWFAMRKR